MKLPEKDVDFIAKHYREGAFSEQKALKRLGFRANRFPMRKVAVAAAVVAVAAVACVFMIPTSDNSAEPQSQIVEPVATPVGVEAAAVKRIDFDNAPLTDVVAEIQMLYDVKITNVPENSDDIRLTLGYEGNAEDVVATINDLLGTNLAVEQ
jgi:ferric-dicitrate binding protein FerR (iron transport regulator)